MPTYVYECSNCKYSFELKQSFADKPKKRCEKCKKHKLFKVIQPVDFAIKLANSEIKTVGHLANRNTETMAKSKLEELKEKDPVEQRKKKAKEKAPWWRKGTEKPNMKLAKMSKAEQKKYIFGE